MINVFVELAVSLALGIYGYIVACCYVNGIKLRNVNKDILKIKGKSKVIYLSIYILVIVTLTVVLSQVYVENNLLQNLRLVSLVSFIFPMAAVDFRLQKIPNSLILSAIVFRIVIFVAEIIVYRDNFFALLKNYTLGAVIISGFFFLLMLVFKNSIGMGDVKLFFVMRFYQGIWGTINSVFFSLVASFVISVTLLITKRKGKKDTISFCPSILVGTVVGIMLSGI
mgnify:CR=1 FL=1